MDRRRLLMCVMALAVTTFAAPVPWADTGDLDPGFGVDGTVVTPPPLHAVLAQPDGRLVVGGWEGNSPEDFLLARHLPDGTLDPSFDGDGLVRTTVGISGSYLSALALQSDGKILAAGGGNELVLVRYTTDGSLDTTFDGDGIVRTAGAAAADVAVQADGRIVVAGFASPSTFAILRYQSDGSLDPTFGVGGIVTTPIEEDSYASALVIRPDGKIVAVGDATSSPFSSVVVIRYDTDGNLDPTFDGDGVVTVAEGAQTAAGAIAVQPDGKVVTAGYTQGPNSRVISLARFDEDGTLDATFDGDGIATMPLEGVGTATDLVVQPDGKLLVAGRLEDLAGWGELVLARFSADGSADRGFYCGNGAVVTPFGSDTSGWALAVQPDGKPVVAGYGVDSQPPMSFGILSRFGGTPVTFNRGVTPAKLIMVNSLASTGTAKTVYVSRDLPIWKGSATNIDKIRARLVLSYDDGGAAGAFDVGCGREAGWVVNKDSVAKFVNRLAPGGPSQTKVVVIKPGSVARFVGRGVGEDPFDVLAAGSPVGSVFASLEVTNDTERNRHCSEFPACVWTSIAAGTGAKLVCRGGTPDGDCRAAQ